MKSGYSGWSEIVSFTASNWELFSVPSHSGYPRCFGESNIPKKALNNDQKRPYFWIIQNCDFFRSKMTTIFLSFVKQKSLLKSRLTRSQKAQNWITIYVGMRPTSGLLRPKAPWPSATFRCARSTVRLGVCQRWAAYLHNSNKFLSQLACFLTRPESWLQGGFLLRQGRPKSIDFEHMKS